MFIVNRRGFVRWLMSVSMSTKHKHSAWCMNNGHINIDIIDWSMNRRWSKEFKSMDALTKKHWTFNRTFFSSSSSFIRMAGLCYTFHSLVVQINQVAENSLMYLFRLCARVKNDWNAQKWWIKIVSTSLLSIL